ncbi:MAG TPA: phosphodiester glycosidase family protein [Firmicutes bacterium]|nr:phosphodiester glycosidase family protein [Bacillota bacterium]
MRQRGGITLQAFFLLFLFFHSSSLFAAAPDQVLLLPDKIVLTLPKEPGQAFQVSSTPHPMKIIIDSNLPLQGFAAAQTIKDPALGQIRSSTAGGLSRLVLDFNYLLPDFFVQETEQELRVEISKTFAHTTERVVARGIVYGHQRRADSFGPNVVNYLKVNLKGGNEVKPVLAQNRILGSENVSALAKRFGAVAAINGAFFDGNGRPVGIVVLDGQIISEPFAARTALGLGPQGPLMERVDWCGEVLSGAGVPLAALSGVNRPRLADELIVYTPYYGNRTATNAYGFEATIVNGVVTALQTGNSEIPKDGLVVSGHGIKRDLLSSWRVGDEITIDFRLNPPWLEQGIDQIIGGGPRLVRDGAPVNSGEEELFRTDVLQGRAPRTAIGITADGELLLVTVNGRQPNISVGMSLAELGRLLMELGAVQGMNLDGGGSTTMVIHDLVLNLPSNGKERPVSNAILVLAPESR